MTKVQPSTQHHLKYQITGLLFLWRWFPARFKDAWNALNWNLSDTVTEARQTGVDLPQLFPFPVRQLTHNLQHTHEPS